MKRRPTCDGGWSGVAAGAAITVTVRGRERARHLAFLRCVGERTPPRCARRRDRSRGGRRMASVGWSGPYRSHRRQPSVVAAVIGMTLPPALGQIMRSIGQLSAPIATVDESSPSFVPAAEQAAMRWLRENTPAGDIVATNVHCRPAD